MPRRPRLATGGLAYHVLNRRVGRVALFEKPADYLAFENILKEAHDRTNVRIAAYCLMPDHWHLLLWPRSDGELSEVMRWITQHTPSAGMLTTTHPGADRYIRDGSNRSRFRPTSTSSRLRGTLNVTRYEQSWSTEVKSGDGRVYFNLSKMDWRVLTFYLSGQWSARKTGLNSSTHPIKRPS